jgi:hypothetical protein
MRSGTPAATPARRLTRAYARLEVGDHIMDLQSADGEMIEGQLSAPQALAGKYRLMYQRHLAIFRKLAHDVHAF